MGYKIAIGKDMREIEIDASDACPDEYIATINGQKVKANVLKRESNRVIVGVGERVYSIIDVKRTQSDVSFQSNGERIRAELENPSRPSGASSLIATANELVASNFPAKIVKVAVKKGDVLKQGETLIVLEAMKMEAQIKATADCTVEEVFVKEGEMVERGKNMVRLKFR